MTLDFAHFLKAQPSLGDVHIAATPQSNVQSPAPVTQLPPKKPKTFAATLDDEVDGDIIKFSFAQSGGAKRHLKPIDENNSFTPLPYDPQALHHIRPDQTPRFYSALTDSANLPQKSMPMNSLVATQNRVNTGKVNAIMNSTTPGKPPVVARMAGRNYIIDGHHRVAADYLRGANNVNAHFIDLEPQSDALKDWEQPFSVAKSVEAKQQIFGWASVVEKDGGIVIDKQGSIILPEDLEAAAYQYMLKSRDQGHMHSTMNVGNCIESMVFTKEKQDIMGIDLKKVGWWTGFQVSDPAVWQLHKDGKLNEFSIGGIGRKVTV